MRVKIRKTVNGAQALIYRFARFAAGSTKRDHPIWHSDLCVHRPCGGRGSYLIFSDLLFSDFPDFN
jgi:hypothetical protein